MKILSIETSADETAAAVTDGRRVLSNVIFSQISTHTKWGGIYPMLAKRAHEDRIDWIVEKTLTKFTKLEARHPTGVQARIMNKIDLIAVTYGPGLAVALEVGIKKAKELTIKFNKKLIAVNHLEGHIYSSFVQNSQGNPLREFKFPYLALIVSGGHTEIVLWKDHLKYEVIGETRDDAAGEALDKAAKMLGLGYPGGPVLERLASEVDNKDFYNFPRPMIKSKNLDMSFSGLKTSFYYYLKRHSGPLRRSFSEASLSGIVVSDDSGGAPTYFGTPHNDKIQLRQLASSFQAAVFDTIIAKTEFAIQKTGISRLVVGGGVIANLHLRKLLRGLVAKNNGEVYFPPFKYLTGDNAAMIGVAAYHKAKKRIFVSDLEKLDRIPRLTLANSI